MDRLSTTLANALCDYIVTITVLRLLEWLGFHAYA